MNRPHSSFRLMSALATLLLGVACAAQPQPSGTWFRRHDLYFCDWEGGHNQGSLSFISNGYFAEQLEFEGRGRSYSTNASGHWTLKGDKLTVDLDTIEGKGERSPESQRMRLRFTVSQHSSVLRLTLMEFEHEGPGEPRAVVDIPDGEQCTAVYEQHSTQPRTWRRALAALRTRLAPTAGG